ncbi:hypothetical protein Bpfe_024814 [Biomphalaria pfeifferi]|uniref:Uncharacterized protein n=1 Tax=Biomphalaria pfeifferi TaxID=112525 RepID=A0AAD8B0E4_BIOPF|nr:hypothetical protein Bpfe_024814 [Biomphalaria pfeifferi]
MSAGVFAPKNQWGNPSAWRGAASERISTKSILFHVVLRYREVLKHHQLPYHLAYRQSYFHFGRGCGDVRIKAFTRVLI